MAIAANRSRAANNAAEAEIADAFVAVMKRAED